MAEETQQTMASEQKAQPNIESSPNSSPMLGITESKIEIANRLTSLISTFRDETEQQDQILSGLQKEALNNPDFGQKTHAKQWTTHEVCYWLTTIDLQDYVDPFYKSNIDGAILLNDITHHLLKNELNVKPIHCSKILREIESLKSQHIDDDDDDNDSNLNDIMATIKKENDDLLGELERQKSLNAELKADRSHDTQSISNGNGALNDKSLREVIESQNGVIEDLKKQLKQLQIVSNESIKQLSKKNKKLQDGYIQIETHYQTQLDHSRTKSKNLEARISSMNDGDNGQIGLLWTENENTAKDLENEREKRIMLEASLKSVQLHLNRERQKRKLLESQTSRLTAELTKYLTSTHNIKDIDKERHHNTQIIKENNIDNEPIISTLRVFSTDNNHSKLRRKPSMDARAGWLKFLSSAGSMGNRLSGIQSKLRKKSEDDSDVDVQMDSPSSKERQRKATLSEAVINTFKKIQNAAHQKIHKKQQKQGYDDDKKFVDIEDVVNGVYVNDNNDVKNMDIDDTEYVEDEDSSAEQAHQIVITSASDAEDSLVRKDGAIEMEFTPDMEVLTQVVEPDPSF